MMFGSMNTKNIIAKAMCLLVLVFVGIDRTASADQTAVAAVCEQTSKVAGYMDQIVRQIHLLEQKTTTKERAQSTINTVWQKVYESTKIFVSSLSRENVKIKDRNASLNIFKKQQNVVEKCHFGLNDFLGDQLKIKDHIYFANTCRDPFKSIIKDDCENIDLEPKSILQKPIYHSPPYNFIKFGMTVDDVVAGCKKASLVCNPVRNEYFESYILEHVYKPYYSYEYKILRLIFDINTKKITDFHVETSLNSDRYYGGNLQRLGVCNQIINELQDGQKYCNIYGNNKYKLPLFIRHRNWNQKLFYSGDDDKICGQDTKDITEIEKTRACFSICGEDLNNSAINGFAYKITIKTYDDKLDCNISERSGLNNEKQQKIVFEDITDNLK